MTEASRPAPLFEVTVEAPVDEVWRALREPDRLMQWFGWEADTLADEVTYIFIDHAEADPEARTVRFAPWEGKADAFELEPRGAHTLVRVIRTGAASGDWDAHFDDLREGWLSFVQQLKLALERHPREARRTLYLSGRPRGGPARGALGLDRLADGAAGRLAGAPGGPIDVETRWQGGFQTVVGVPAWGDGLLAVIDRPGGGSQATLTTYGLDEDRFAALEGAWREWWATRFEPAPAA